MILVSADMEGASGVSRWAEVTPGDPAYERGRAALARDVAAVAAVYAEHGVPVAVTDGHWFGTNLRAEDLGLPVAAGTRMPFGMVEGVQDPAVEGVVLLAYHGMAGSAGTLSHTWSDAFSEVLLDGEPIGEIGLSALLAWSVGVPVIGLSGDDVACAEFRRRLPGLPVAEVKRAVGHEAAVLYPDAAERLRAMARRSLEGRGRGAVGEKRTHTLAARMSTVVGADRAAITPGTSRGAPTELAYVGDVRRCFDALRTWAALADA
jgi:D-amino peptidase